MSPNLVTMTTATTFLKYAIKPIKPLTANWHAIVDLNNYVLHTAGGFSNFKSNICHQQTAINYQNSSTCDGHTQSYVKNITNASSYIFIT